MNAIPALWVIDASTLLGLILLGVFIWKIKFSITQFIAALNTINSQVWAFLILTTGVTTAILFHRAGIAVDIAAGVIGAAVNMFNSLIKPTAPGTQHLEVDSSTIPPTPPMTPAPSPTITISPSVVPATPAVEPPKEGV